MTGDSAVRAENVIEIRPKLWIRLSCSHSQTRIHTDSAASLEHRLCRLKAPCCSQVLAPSCGRRCRLNLIPSARGVGRRRSPTECVRLRARSAWTWWIIFRRLRAVQRSDPPVAVDEEVRRRSRRVTTTDGGDGGLSMRRSGRGPARPRGRIWLTAGPTGAPARRAAVKHRAPRPPTTTTLVGNIAAADRRRRDATRRGDTSETNRTRTSRLYFTADNLPDRMSSYTSEQAGHFLTRDVSARVIDTTIVTTRENRSPRVVGQ